MSVNTKCFFTVILWIFLLVIFILMRQSKKAMKKCFVYLILFVVFCVVSVSDLMPKGLYYHVVDGDSLEYGAVRIRLKDIDAPELFQYCFDKDNKKYYCGKAFGRYFLGGALFVPWRHCRAYTQCGGHIPRNHIYIPQKAPLGQYYFMADFVYCHQLGAGHCFIPHCI